MVWYVDRMDERRLTKEIYEADVGGNAGGPWRTFLDQIGEVLEKGRVKSTRNAAGTNGFLCLSKHGGA
jgi:hypothetical protein